MEFIIGILLSALVSILNPLVMKLANWIVSKVPMELDDAVKLIIAVLVILIATFMWIVGDKGFWQDFMKNAVVILTMAAGYYEYVYKAIILKFTNGKSLEKIGQNLIK